MDNTYIIESSLRHEFLSMFKTENAIINSILTVFIITIVSFITKKFFEVPAFFLKVWNEFIIYIKLLKKPKSNNKINKTIIIESLTRERTINELYKAVQWYLTTTVNLVKESNVIFTFDKKIELDEYNELRNKNINKNINYGNKNKFFYLAQNGIRYEIEYFFNNNLVAIYTDKKREKENHTIYLTTEINKNTQTDIFEEFSVICMKEYAKSLVNKKWIQKIFTNNNNKWTETPSNNRRKIETVILRDGINKLIIDDLNLFLNSELWYNDRDIPYKRGYLFKGSPGTGKTSMIKAISTFTKRHIHYLILSNIQNDNELLNLLSTINYKETILVLEDIDCACETVKSRDIIESQEMEFYKNNDNIQNNYRESIQENHRQNSQENHRQNSQENHRQNFQENHRQNSKENKSRLTLSGILNALDGVFNCDGRIIIMTTNHPEILDPALIRRGRIDMEIEFLNCDRYQISKLYENFYNRQLPENILCQIKSDIYSPAYISSLLLSHRNNPNHALDEIID
ncbi:AAA family ATPase [Cotonvirus japonicus]|uniref:AAA family ATPase n=1 Tax=Cotonvirus japonicus TaxID=2811091 RepID=A0ABM7NTC4_9VIRU|nr:AAA family ATPase [Cotonvirus japonicus]BCS83379.1 AAA family ATPase [Cotonvirus japonicus]